MRFILLIIFIISANFSVAAQETYILFGKGGGFTGKTNVYKVFPNGKIQKGSGLLEIKYSQCSKIRKSAARKLFSGIDNLKTEPFSHPGNMYYFITVFDGAKETKYTWGANDFSAPEEILSIYNKADSLFVLANFKPIEEK